MHTLTFPCVHVSGRRSRQEILKHVSDNFCLIFVVSAWLYKFLIEEQKSKEML
jgi:hypothetical protein